MFKVSLTLYVVFNKLSTGYAVLSMKNKGSHYIIV